MKSKRIISVLLTLSLLSVFIVLPASAAETSRAAKSNANSGIHINSTVPIKGPTSDPIEGKTVYRSRYENWAELTTAANFIADIGGYGTAEKALAKASYLIAGISAIGKGNVYYARTEYYTDETKMEYYFKYDFYKNANYTGYLGTDYSYLYTNWY